MGWGCRAGRHDVLEACVRDDRVVVQEVDARSGRACHEFGRLHFVRISAYHLCWWLAAAPGFFAVAPVAHQDALQRLWLA
jgi:hypothetical protein